MRNKLKFQRKYLFLVTLITMIVGVLLLWGDKIMGTEEVIKEAKIDFVYVYGDEDSAIFRILLTKTGDEHMQIEYIVCPLQIELFKDGRWSYSKGIIPEEETKKLFQKLFPQRLNTSKNFYTWKGTTAHHPALLKIYFHFENKEEFKKEIQIEDYPQGVKDLPVSLKEIVEIGKLLQDQITYASDKLYGDHGKCELSRNIIEINSMVSGELKYLSSQAIKVIQSE